MIYLRVLLENDPGPGGMLCRHGLSVYGETSRHKILFDMGPDDSFLLNSRALGHDLTKVDTAVLSHGHHDHGGGLEHFFRINDTAQLYLHPAALEEYYSCSRSPVPRYIGLEPGVKAYWRRMCFVTDERMPDGQLRLFQAVRAQTPPLQANAKLLRRDADAYRQDDFRHECNLLITEGDQAVLLAGCAHNGIVPIMERCTALLGRAPDVVLGGFHLFSPGSGETEPEEVIRRIGRQLAQWPTRYYTGHCTGSVAFDQLKQILADRLQPLYTGLELTLPTNKTS